MSASPQAEGGAAVAVSVIVPTFNEERHVAECVAGLRAQRFEGELEFLLIDGCSEDRTREIVTRLAAEDPRIRLLSNPRRGIPFALNIGLRAARGEFVARMDAHTVYPDDYLRSGVERLRRGDADWVGGPQIPHGRDDWTRRIAIALDSPLGIGGASFRNATEEIETDTVYTGIWRRRTLERHGGWDERWAVNEDSELAARIRAAGGRIVCVPRMGARYIPRGSLRSLGRQYFRYGVYREKTCRAHPESMRPSHVLPPGLVLAGAAACARRRRWLAGPARLALGTYAAALGATATRAARQHGGNAAFVPAVLAVMHASWGAGFLIGAVRFGPPWRALAGVAHRGARGG